MVAPIQVLGEPIWNGNQNKSATAKTIFAVLGEPIWDGND